MVKSRKLIITPDQFTSLRRQCLEASGQQGIFNTKAGLELLEGLARDCTRAFSYDISDQYRTRRLLALQKQGGQPVLFSRLRLDGNPAFDGNPSPFDFTLLVLMRNAFRNKDIDADLTSPAQVHLIPKLTLSDALIDLLGVHNGISIASYNHELIECLNALAALVRSEQKLPELERYKSDPALIEAVALVQRYDVITELLPLIATREK